ncbi:hypothetical protein [Maribacter litoralis]|uniref:Lipocalin-like domain-containing protein n=1 Tax=Maribacter litoralis TaxID=2059726 RepID=A0A653PQK8_9FLAO|nr:hypothetical protein [Maribacter litoralis]VXB31981.1 conserved exported hypothetical protein [Maribacter litoralis]
MKKITALLVCIVLLLSCSSDDDYGLESTQFVYAEQQWTLVKMTGSFQNSETIGSEMEWQEYYTFSPEGTFIKSRTVDEVVYEATGSFEVIEFDNDPNHYLELTYQTGNTLVGNCTADDKELLVYRNSTIISSLWMACDGPGLDYELVK